jgi:two-component system response regulator WspF
MRVAIVNDMALAREVLRRLLLSSPDYQVAWTAEDGEEAVRKAAQDPPDAILMDLVMPRMDGVEATRRIMKENPCPILLVTSSVSGNFNMVYQAMGHGGLDAVNTPTLHRDGNVRDGEALLKRLAHLAKTKRVGSTPVFASPSTVALSPEAPPMLALGASTGGPEALARIVETLPADFPAAVVIVQHIAVDFVPSLVGWLQRRSRLHVCLAREGDTPKVGVIQIAATNDHLIVGRNGRLAYSDEPRDYPYRPSVDVFFGGLAAAWPKRGVAALLTGMGTDGARGLLRLRQAGWLTLAQDQTTSVVYGMPYAAAQLGAACRILALSDLAHAIIAHFRR